MPNTTLQQTSSSDITTVSNTLYNRTLWTTQHVLSLDHVPIINTINIRHDYRLQQNRWTFTNYKKADSTQFMEETEFGFAQTNIYTANRIFTNIILMADKHNIPKGKMHSNCMLLPEDIVCKITQRNNIRRANTCDPALKLLNEEITFDIQKHKQTTRIIAKFQRQQPTSGGTVRSSDLQIVVVVVYPLPWPLLVGGVRCSRLWSTSQLLRPSGQQCSHSGGVCPQIQGRQCGAYVGAVEEMMCVVCVDVTEGA